MTGYGEGGKGWDGVTEAGRDQSHRVSWAIALQSQEPESLPSHHARGIKVPAQVPRLVTPREVVYEERRGKLWSVQS